MAQIEFLGRFRHLELTHLLHEGPVAVHKRDEGLFTGSPFQVLTVAAAPFPGVVDVEDGLHSPLAKFHKIAVKAHEEGVIVHAGSGLESGLHAGEYAIRAVSANKGTEVGEAKGLEGVKLPLEALYVTATAF